MKEAALLSLSLAFAACSSGSGGPLLGIHPDGGAAGTGAAGTGAAGTKTYTFRNGINRDVDMLFMIDNSIGMKPLQQKLTAAFPALIDFLKALPGGLPNLHFAVVTSDMGAGVYDATEIPSCRHGGDQGRFQSEPKGTTCADGSLNAGQTFIIADNANRAANYTGDLASVLSCIAAVGNGGCGFEHQIASVLRAFALDGGALEPTNVNFLRPNAFLFIVMLTDEDDCSAPPDSLLFNPASRFVSDPLGPVSSFRCNEFGHLCAGQRPPRTPAALGTDLGTCKSLEDGTLIKVADAVAKLKLLKADPTRVFVAALAGPPTPYVVEPEPATLKDDPSPTWPSVRQSCVSNVGESADPAVRINEWVRGFGDNGLFQEACADSFAPAMQAIGQQVGKAVAGDDCFPPAVAPRTCTAVDHSYDERSMRTDTPLPRCDDNGQKAPCWSTVDGDPQCATRPRLDLKRPPGQPPANLSTTFTCPS